MTLTEFLLARIAEDEVAAKHALAGDIDHLPFVEIVDGRRIYFGGNATRILAECAAKRELITRAANLIVSFGDWDAADVEGVALWNDVNRRERSHAWDLLHVLAEVYADHPDHPDPGL